VASTYPIALFWVDLETDRLTPKFRDQVLDMTPLNILEIGAIITDFDLRPVADGYTEVVKMTKEIADGLRANPEVLEMHQKSGLIEASIKDGKSISEIEDEILELIKKDTAISEGELQIAGSGVARFDFAIIEAKMPRLARYFHYAPYDVGVLRRTAKTMAGGDVVNIPRSYKEGVKQHRAWDDVTAHLEEAQRFREFFQRAVALGAHVIPSE
jgi:oligoribonuclease (3'-5' exoribonuclease)